MVVFSRKQGKSEAVSQSKSALGGIKPCGNFSDQMASL